MDSILHAFYINLDERVDRKKHVEEQLQSVGIQATRFPAIKMNNGAIGCSLSHLKCLETAYQNKWEHVLICEDDITFLNPELFVKQFESFLKNHSEWDVVLLGGNNVPPYTKIDDTCIQVTKCQTTTGYVVNGHYIKTLMENIKMGVAQLLRFPEKHVMYAIDKYWFHLQEKDKWYFITPPTVIQAPGYSDIEKRNTNYGKIMTDIDKAYLFRGGR